MNNIIKDIINERYEFNYKDWSFNLDGYNEIQKAYKVIAKKDNLVEAMFVDGLYIENEEGFKRECRRFYDNCLNSF